MLEPRELTGSPGARPVSALPQHRRTRRCIELRRLTRGVTQQLVHRLDRHPSLSERRDYGVPEERRGHPRGDLCLLRRFLDHGLDAPWGVACRAVCCKELPHHTLPYMRPQLLGAFRHDGNVAALPTLGLRNQDHLFLKEDVLNFDRVFRPNPKP